MAGALTRADSAPASHPAVDLRGLGGQAAANPMKSNFRLLLAASLALTLAGLAHATDISGKWQAEFDSQIGVQKYVYTFKVDGEKLTGTAAGDRGGEKSSVDIKDGKVAGDTVTFVEPMSFQGQDVTIEYTGKITGDNEIKFSRKVGDFATEDLVAKRVVAP